VTESQLPQKCKDLWSFPTDGSNTSNTSLLEDSAEGQQKHIYQQSLAFPSLLGGPELVGWLPIVTSQKFLGVKQSSKSSKVRKAVIVMQEYSGDNFELKGTFWDICTFMRDVMIPQDAFDETLVLMPWFPESKYKLKPEDYDGEAGNAIGLKLLEWDDPDHYARASDSKEGVSVFQVIDRLVEILQSDVGAERFPNLDTVTISGFSGGCKTATRWAALSEKALDGRLRVQVSGAGCNSFLFLDSYRPAPSCRPKRSTGKKWKCNSFQAGIDCDRYDNWEHGLAYVGQEYSYIRRITNNRTLREKTIKDFVSKHVQFMSGDEDDCNCNTDEEVDNANYCYHPFKPFCNDVYPDACGIFAVCGTVGGSCTKNVQGWTRLQRFINYMGYLTDFYSRSYGISFEPEQHLYSGAHHKKGYMQSKHFVRLVYGTSRGDEP